MTISVRAIHESPRRSTTGALQVPRGSIDESIAVLDHTFPVAELDLTPKV